MFNNLPKPFQTYQFENMGLEKKFLKELENKKILKVAV